MREPLSSRMGYRIYQDRRTCQADKSAKDNPVPPRPGKKTRVIRSLILLKKAESDEDDSYEHPCEPRGPRQARASEHPDSVGGSGQRGGWSFTTTAASAGCQGASTTTAASVRPASATKSTTAISRAADSTSTPCRVDRGKHSQFPDEGKSVIRLVSCSEESRSAGRTVTLSRT